VRGVRRPVPLLLGSDYAAQCDVLGQKGASVMQPCLLCRRTRSLSGAKAVLDAAYETFQDLFVSRHLREATHYSNRMACDGGTPPVGRHLTYEQRFSVERSPLLAINPKQILPIPRHRTQGDNHRYLRLAIEMGMVCRTGSDGASAGRKAAAKFALDLVGLLHDKGRVRPTPYHGGLSIGRDCRKIGDSCAILCAALKGKVSLTHLAA